MPPKACDAEIRDPNKLQAQNESEFQKLGLDSAAVDWATVLQPGICSACKQKFGDPDKDPNARLEPLCQAKQLCS